MKPGSVTRRVTHHAGRAVLTGAALACVVAACSSSSGEPAPAEGDAAVEQDATLPFDVDAGEAAAQVDASKPTGQCASAFGSALTAGFGRIDGVVYAVQKPSDSMCVMPNRDHVIVQVLMNGAVYRMVINVQSDRAGSDPEIRIGVLPHALPAPAFAEGWHTDAPLDYVTSLGAHADATFSPLDLEEAVTKIAAEVKVGDPISVYAFSGAGRPESAHLVHRNKANEDGAVVVAPTTTPRFLMFHFASQTF